jgi:hypothetical protein
MTRQRNPLDLEKIREGDRLLRRARALNPNVRLPSMADLKKITRKVGRPQGDEDTCVVAIRIPVALRDRLDRYLDRLETQHGLKGTRAAVSRRALEKFLDEQDQDAAGATRRRR